VGTESIPRVPSYMNAETTTKQNQYAGKIRSARRFQNSPKPIGSFAAKRATTNGRYSRKPEITRNTGTPMSV
jgi:hypothetical protein